MYTHTVLVVGAAVIATASSPFRELQVAASVPKEMLLIVVRLVLVCLLTCSDCGNQTCISFLVRRSGKGSNSAVCVEELTCCLMSHDAAFSKLHSLDWLTSGITLLFISSTLSTMQVCFVQAFSHSATYMTPVVTFQHLTTLSFCTLSAHMVPNGHPLGSNPCRLVHAMQSGLVSACHHSLCTTVQCANPHTDTTCHVW